MADTGEDMRRWPSPTDGDGTPLAPPRRKRSTVVLWELVGLPVAVTAWGFAIYRGLFYTGPAIDQQDQVAAAFFGVGVIFLMGLVLIAGVSLGLVVTAVVGTLFGFSARIPRTSAWVSSALVALWCAAAIVLWHLYFVGIEDLASPPAS